MHEMALAQSVIELVEERARADVFSRVRTIRLAIGALAHVDPRALEFGFDVVARGTIAEGARLAIDRPAGRAWCTDCSETVDVGERGEPCPKCGGFKWMLTEGDDLRVVELEVE